MIAVISDVADRKNGSLGQLLLNRQAELFVSWIFNALVRGSKGGGYEAGHSCGNRVKRSAAAISSLESLVRVYDGFRSAPRLSRVEKILSTNVKRHTGGRIGQQKVCDY